MRDSPSSVSDEKSRKSSSSISSTGNTDHSSKNLHYLEGSRTAYEKNLINSDSEQISNTIGDAKPGKLLHSSAKKSDRLIASFNDGTYDFSNEIDSGLKSSKVNVLSTHKYYSKNKKLKKDKEGRRKSRPHTPPLSTWRSGSLIISNSAF